MKAFRTGLTAAMRSSAACVSSSEVRAPEARSAETSVSEWSKAGCAGGRTGSEGGGHEAALGGACGGGEEEEEEEGERDGGAAARIEAGEAAGAVVTMGRKGGEEAEVSAEEEEGGSSVTSGQEARTRPQCSTAVRQCSAARRPTTRTPRTSIGGAGRPEGTRRQRRVGAECSQASNDDHSGEEASGRTSKVGLCACELLGGSGVCHRVVSRSGLLQTGFFVEISPVTRSDWP